MLYGKNIRCAVKECDNDSPYFDCYVIKPQISEGDESLQIRIYYPKNENELKT